MTQRLILASQSPRREEILRRLEIPFEVRVADVDESGVSYVAGRPEQAVMAAAYAKALRVASEASDGLVLGFDTAVIVDGRRLGKPCSEDEAVAMVLSLGAKRHDVLTGAAVVDATRVGSLPAMLRPTQTKAGHVTRVEGAAIGFERTGVVFEELSAERARCYVAKGESLDKAGAYGIQEKASLLVKSINGCYFNVVGLPVHLLCVLLSGFGVDLLALAGQERHGGGSDV